MTRRPRVLDLYCGAGGAGMGYHRAGWDVVGVDIEPQPRYPFPLIVADALEVSLEGFDLIHASPPCQAYSAMRHLPWLSHIEWWDSIPPTRERLVGSGIPYVLENVSRAPLDGVTLCGAMFGLRFADGSPLYRHRLFESSVFMLAPGHPRHHETLEPGRMLGSRGRRINGRDPGGDVMGTPWMTAEERAQAIPPAYTEWIGLEVLHRLGVPA